MQTAFEIAAGYAQRINAAYDPRACPRFLYVSRHIDGISLQDTDQYKHPFHPKKDYGVSTHLSFTGLNTRLVTLNKLECSLGEMRWFLSPDEITEGWEYYPRNRWGGASHAITLTWSSGQNPQNQMGQLVRVQIRTWDFPKEDGGDKQGHLLYEINESGALTKVNTTLGEERDAKFNQSFWDWYRHYYGSTDGYVYFPERIDYESKARQVLCLSQLDYFAYALESSQAN